MVAPILTLSLDVLDWVSSEVVFAIQNAVISGAVVVLHWLGRDSGFIRVV